MASTEKQMGVVVDEVLHDNRASIGQCQGQRVFSLGAAQETMFEAHAINDCLAFVDEPVWLSRLGRDVGASFFVLLARHAVSHRADFPSHVCEREKRGFKYRCSE